MSDAGSFFRLRPSSCPPKRPGGLSSLASIARLTLLSSALLLPAASPWSAPTLAQSPATAPALSARSWTEIGYGMSLQPSAEAQVLAPNTGDVLVHFLEPGISQVSVSIRESPQPITLQPMQEMAANQFGFAHPTAVIRKVDRLLVGERPAMIQVFEVPPGRQTGWMRAVVYIAIDPSTVAILEMTCDLDAFEQAMPSFEAMLGSVHFRDVMDLEAERSTMVQAADQWRAGLTRQHLHAHLVPEQWWRIRQGDLDVGFMRIEQRQEQWQGQPGILVRVLSHLRSGNIQMRSTRECFESDDQDTEIWSVQTERRDMTTAGRDRRPTHQGLAHLPIEHWSETGLRSGNRITLSLERPTGTEQFAFLKPTGGYLSQVELHLLETLLPDTGGATSGAAMLFYAYHSESQRLAMRTYRSEPMLPGGKRVWIRPAPSRAEVMAIYDPAGELMRRELPDGTVYVPSTEAEIRHLWPDH